MINREILEAQLGLYQQGRTEALAALDRIKADINAFNGAIEACENFLRILGSLEEAKSGSQESSTSSVEEIKGKEG